MNANVLPIAKLLRPSGIFNQPFPSRAKTMGKVMHNALGQNLEMAEDIVDGLRKKLLMSYSVFDSIVK